MIDFTNVNYFAKKTRQVLDFLHSFVDFCPLKRSIHLIKGCQ
jgi:hypothetical protein